MRRRLAAAMLCTLFTLQPGAAALAARSAASPNNASSFASWWAPLVSAVTSSAVYADLTGSGGRYAAMHAPRPVIERPQNTVDAALLMRSRHALKPLIRKGIPRHFVMPPRSALDPRHRRLDPLAMRRSTVKPLDAPLTPPDPPQTSGLAQPLRWLLAAAPPRPGMHPVSPQQRHGGRVNPQVSTNATTGIEHWWTYEERAIPGIGKAMLNVGTGNLLVTAIDVDIPEQGIDLAFQRVYNSQSLHDANGDDGGDPAIFGNLWTNDLDASIIYDSDANTMTVYDIDGTACTYTSNANAPGGWQPCTGEYATLIPTDSNDCTYAWTKKDGTVYWFHTDISGSGCSIAQAKKGQLAQIFARNETNNITFTYSYNGQGQTSEDVTEIDAVHSDGQELVLQFGPIPETSINELSTITLPDGATLQYLYDSSGNLLEVDKPGNNSASSLPSPPQGHPAVPSGDAPETYAYASGTSALQEACGPRCTAAMWSHPNNPNDGSALLLSFNASLQLTSWQVQGVLNFTPTDGTSTPLQSGPSTAFTTWYTANFVYNQGSACSKSTAGTTTMCDTDSHATQWTTDNADRVTQTEDWTGAAEGLGIVTSQTWDANNNLTSTTDANGNVTQYAYDNNQQMGFSCCGNMVEMQLPQITDFSGGSLSPLSYYSYGEYQSVQYNNVTAYCDPVYNQTNGNGWTNSPTDSLCPQNYGAARFTYTYTDANEPYGCLTTMQLPGNYTTTITYATGGGGTGTCGIGLPAETQGAQINQYDGTTRTPTQDFGYDGYGNLTSYDRGTFYGNTLDSWSLGYSTENLNNWKTENDPKIQNAAITSYSCHYLDGSLFYTETPSQHAADGNPSCPAASALLAGNVTPPTRANAYYYDLDGDEVKVITHKGCDSYTGCPGATTFTECATGESNPIGTTCKYYDGLDRLVETIEPYDTRSFSGGAPYEFYAFRWMNRYIYDLSGEGGSASLQISDSTGTISGVVAYGNLYKTQEYLPTSGYPTGALGHGQYQSGQWDDIRGTSFDGLDRPVSKYELAYGTTAVTTNTYDCTDAYDLLCSTANAVGQTTTYTYDDDRRVREINFSGTAPLADNRTYKFDADGRIASATNSMGTLSYTYDLDGYKTSVTEPSNEYAASLICYGYYGDGMREYLSIGLPSDTCGSIPQRSQPSNGGISEQNLLSYSYTNDALPLTEEVNWLSNQELFSWTYTPSERELTETDPLTGQSVALPPGGGGNTQFAVKSYSYDQYGRVSQLTFPQGWEESSFQYDTDDEIAGYTIGGQNGPQRNLTLNARGELLEDALSNSLFDYAQGPTYSANGAQVGNGDTSYEGSVIQAPPTTLQFDERSNMATCIPDPQWALQGGTDNTLWNYSYDGAGRQTGASPSTGSCVQPTGTGVTSYDAENHLQQTTNPWILNDPPGSTYTQANVTWGPDVRHRGDHWSGGGTASETAHWDGDTMLFAAESGALNPQLYIGKLGVMDSAGDTYIADRDQTGSQLAIHASTNTAPPGGGNTWDTGLTTGSVRNLFIGKGDKQEQTLQLSIGSCGYTYNNTPYTCPAFAPTFAMTRSDGYQMIGGLVQGSRTYDPTTGQWLTPDAYAGDVRDPMSQKPFMWNNNNPIEWNDPNGYDPTNPTILVNARDAFGPVLNGIVTFTGAPKPQHTYITINYDNPRGKACTTIYISFGPTHGRLKQQGQGYEAGHVVNASHEIGNTQQQANAIEQNAKSLDSQNLPYLGSTLNSNSATTSNAAAGGKDIRGIFPGMFVPGQDQVPLGPPRPTHKPT
jgi:RHS repeat-associated protein